MIPLCYVYLKLHRRGKITTLLIKNISNSEHRHCSNMITMIKIATRTEIFLQKEMLHSLIVRLGLTFA